ncbi:MAG: CoA transferase [Chloroflexi bacterium]|nr:CoA transferase [Chloroflexota bacterium]
MEPSAPLAGIRVVDFSWWLAGPQATRIMADFGAEVIKIETKAPHVYRMTPPWRKQGVRLRDASQVDSPNLSGTFNNHNRNKLGITLNVKDPRGMALLRRLIAVSDVVIENFSSRVMESWGLGYPQLQALKPDIIYVSLAGMGHWGRDRDIQTMGPIVQALSGLTWMSGFPDLPPAGWGYSFMDHTGGYFAVTAIMAALYHRQQTGQGQWIDLSQTEAGNTLLGAEVLEYTVMGHARTRNGNRLDHPAAAPHGIYRCAGEDRWIAIAVFTAAEWRALSTAMGEPEWTRDPRFATHLGRVAHQDDLGRFLESWTCTWEDYALMDLLQRHGVAAGVVQNGVDRFLRDPQLQERGMFVTVEHPEMGPVPVEGMPIHLSETPATFRRATPLLGEHNAEVLSRILGLSAEEIAALAQDGVI